MHMTSVLPSCATCVQVVKIVRDRSLSVVGSGRRRAVRSLSTALCRRRAMSLALALAGLSLFGASPASAKTFNPKPGTEELVEDVNKGNADGEANTIVLEGSNLKSYLPPKKLVYTNTKGALTIEGPAGSPSVAGGPAKLNGASIEAEPTETLFVGIGATVTLKNLMFIDGGLEQPPAIEDQGTLNVEGSTIADSLTEAVFVNPGATLTVTNSTISNGAVTGVVNQGTASFFNSTVAFNKLGGIENSGVLNLTNTIVAENTKGGGKDCELLPATTSDHSLDSDGSCGVGTFSNTNPKLQTARSEE